MGGGFGEGNSGSDSVREAEAEAEAQIAFWDRLRAGDRFVTLSLAYRSTVRMAVRPLRCAGADGKRRA
jgi:hypothetical protein